MYIENALCCCGREFYQTPGAVQYITDTVFTEMMDPYRLKIALNILWDGSIYVLQCCCMLVCDEAGGNELSFTSLECESFNLYT